jgi:hypothetical protein
LSNYTNTNALTSAISNAQYQGSLSANLNLGLNEMLANQFTQANGDRPGVQNFAIILSNGASNPTSAATSAQSAIASGIILIAVGISSRVLQSELTTYVSYPLAPNPNYFATTTSGVNLTPFVNPITARICLSSAQSDCSGKVFDLVFVLDGITTSTNWNLLIKTISNVVSGLNIGSNAVQVGMVTYYTSAAATNNWYLNSFQDKNSLINAINNLNPSNIQSANSNSLAGLQMMRTQQFTTGNRPDVPDIAIFVTFNPSMSTSSSLQAEALLSHNAGIFIYALGFLNTGFSSTDLYMISSHPHLMYHQWAMIDYSAASFYGFGNAMSDELCHPQLEQYCKTTAYGGYQCFCPLNRCDVIPLNGTQCVDTNECLINNGGCQQNCTNTNGRVTCLCRPGFTISPDTYSCDDIDDCLSNPCKNGTVCVNSYGSFYCIKASSFVNANSVSSGLTDNIVPQSNAGLGAGTTIVLTAVLSAVLAALAIVGLGLLVRYFVQRNRRNETARARNSTISFRSTLNSDNFGSVRSKFSQP